MKKVAFVLLSTLLSVVSTAQEAGFFDKANTFFATYVSEGKVDYDGIKKDESSLKELMESIASNSWTKENEKAYLINVYNLGVINKVIEAYPISSPMEVNSFFEKKDVNLNGENISLDHLENKMLRPVYEDARFHFVLVCGAVSCPRIENFAYVPEKLEMQLDAQAKRALNDPSFIWTSEDGGKLFLSEIFQWYKSDFGKSNADLITYVNKYRTVAVKPDAKIEHYTYDWTINAQGVDNVTNPFAGKDGEEEGSDEFDLQTFTAGSLLGKGQMDFTLFNTIYTEQKNNWQGQDFSGYRSTFVTHLFQYTIGVTKSKRINVGLDVNFRSSATSSDSSFSSVGNAFAYKNNDSTRVGVTSVGARLKLQPFKKVNNFSIQSTVYVPVIPHPEGGTTDDGQNLYWADWDRITWWNQFFIDKTYGKFQLFAEVDLLFRFKRYKSQIGMLDIPSSIFLSYFPTKKMTVYAMTQHVHRFTNNINAHDPQVTDWVIPMNYTASGLGFKYNLMPGFNIELLYSNFWRGTNSGLGSTYNLGIKYIL
ncbi:MAG: DUF547 domain-containing protein [Flavobacteriales bacterium]|nr:DUF547 domain-containing protein [Flavobacteriales bacterium]